MPDSPTTKREYDLVCSAADWTHSACAAESLYKQYEGKPFCVLHYPEKGKDPEFKRAFQRKLEAHDFNFRGVWFPDEASFARVHFIGEADFCGATFSADTDFVAATFDGSAYFDETVFKSGASFANVGFNGQASFYQAKFHSTADFRSAKFTGTSEFRRATFREEALFRYATFQGVSNFRKVIFEGPTNFTGAAFSDDTNFESASFYMTANMNSTAFGAVVRFEGAQFRADALFRDASFKGYADFRAVNLNGTAEFSEAAFAGRVRFDQLILGAASSLDFQFAKIEKPDYVSFHTLRLRPHWFVNVDARKFDFKNVDWDRLNLNEEIGSLEGKNVSSPYHLLANACRQLAVNAEENHHYHAASKFRYMAMDSRQRAHWRRFGFWTLGWWYWLASGYGERAFRAFLVLLGIWFVAGLLYTRVGFARWEPRLASESDVVVSKRYEVGAPLRFSRALTYSAAVLTFQKPEPRPATTAANTVVLLETILGPVQAALLALAIRRKFMR